MSYINKQVAEMAEKLDEVAADVHRLVLRLRLIEERHGIKRDELLHGGVPYRPLQCRHEKLMMLNPDSHMRCAICGERVDA